MQARTHIAQWLLTLPKCVIYCMYASATARSCLRFPGVEGCWFLGMNFKVLPERNNDEFAFLTVPNRSRVNQENCMSAWRQYNELRLCDRYTKRPFERVYVFPVCNLFSCRFCCPCVLEQFLAPCIIQYCVIWISNRIASRFLVFGKFGKNLQTFHFSHNWSNSGIQS